MESFIIDQGSPLFLQSGNSEAIKSENMVKIMLREKIKQKFTEPHYHNQNRAESMVQAVKDLIMKLLRENNTPIEHWCYALEHAVQIMNHSFRPKKRDGKTPIEIEDGFTLDVSKSRCIFFSRSTSQKNTTHY